MGLFSNLREKDVLSSSEQPRRVGLSKMVTMDRQKVDLSKKYGPRASSKLKLLREAAGISQSK